MASRRMSAVSAASTAASSLMLGDETVDVEGLKARIAELEAEATRREEEHQLALADHIKHQDAVYEKYQSATKQIEEMGDWKRQAQAAQIEAKHLRGDLMSAQAERDRVTAQKSQWNKLLKYMSVKKYVHDWRVRRQIRRVHSNITDSLSELMVEEREGTESAFFRDDDAVKSEIDSWVHKSRQLLRKRDRVGVDETVEKLLDVDSIISVSVREVQRQKDKYRLLANSFHKDITRLKHTLMERDAEIERRKTDEETSEAKMAELQAEVADLRALLQAHDEELAETKARERELNTKLHSVSQKLLAKQNAINLFELEKTSRQPNQGSGSGGNSLSPRPPRSRAASIMVRKSPAGAKQGGGEGSPTGSSPKGHRRSNTVGKAPTPTQQPPSPRRIQISVAAKKPDGASDSDTDDDDDSGEGESDAKKKQEKEKEEEKDSKDDDKKDKQGSNNLKIVVKQGDKITTDKAAVYDVDPDQSPRQYMHRNRPHTPKRSPMTPEEILGLAGPSSPSKKKKKASPTKKPRKKKKPKGAGPGPRRRKNVLVQERSRPVLEKVVVD